MLAPDPTADLPVGTTTRSNASVSTASGVSSRASRRATMVAVLGGMLFLAFLASLAVGAKSIPLGTVIEAFTDFDRTNSDHLVVRELRLAAHDRRSAGRCRARCERGSDAGRHPQPSGRSRHPRRQCRCVVHRGDRHLGLRCRLDARPGVVRVHRRSARVGGGVRARVDRPWGERRRFGSRCRVRRSARCCSRSPVRSRCSTRRRSTSSASGRWGRCRAVTPTS